MVVGEQVGGLWATKIWLLGAWGRGPNCSKASCTLRPAACTCDGQTWRGHLPGEGTGKGLPFEKEGDEVRKWRRTSQLCAGGSLCPESSAVQLPGALA